MAQCRDCGAENPAVAKFCEACGAAQAVGCPACGAVPSNPAARFCLNCGQPLAPASAGASPAAPAGLPSDRPVAERRVCSVLFADLVGFTPLSEARDAEEVRELLTRYFDVARTVIARYGGTVEKFIGDAVMAVWGAPVAAEGDAERAVRAALDVVDAVAALGEQVGIPGLAARGGVVTGEVAVTVGAADQGMVAGDAVNTAARVQSTAVAGSVLVDGGTRRAAAAGIAFDDAGMHPLKGKAEPEQLWRPTRVLGGVGGVQRVDGLEAPLIGRSTELRTIKELFHASIDRRSPRLVLVTGPAGVGKSRLGWDFEKYLDGLAIRAWWHRGRCLSYGEGVSYWALAQAVRARLAIAEDDSPEFAATKLSDGLGVIVPDPEERRFVAIRLGRLLGLQLPDDGGGALTQEDLFAGWRLLFERLAATQPVVWLVEDAQYADKGLLDFIDHLVDWSRHLPIFVLVFGRDELTRNYAGFGVGRNRSLLTLDPLDPASMDSLVDALVPGMPSTVRTTITAQAQGVPLYAVETVRSLIDRDVVQPIEGVYRLVGEVGDLAVPDSLHGLLAARLDALPAPVRALVADAAVLGTSFPAEALVAVSAQEAAAVRDGLAELVRREVLEVSSDPLSPERGSYRFAQQLVRQVAYDTLSRRDRKARHLRVASHLRATFADDGDEVADVVARHYRDALDAVPDDPDSPEIRRQAIAMSARAAERANRTGAPRSAAEAYATAATLAEPEAKSQAGRWWEQAAEAADTAGDYDLSLAHAERAGQIYEELGEAWAAARARADAGRALRQAGRYTEARDRLNDALTVLRQAPDTDTVQALNELSAVEVFSGSENAPAVVSETMELAQALGVDARLYAAIMTNAGIDQLFRSQIAHAAALLRESARLAEQTGNLYGQARALVNLAAGTSGFDPSASAAAGRRGIEISRQCSARNMLGFAVANLIDVLLLTGEWDEAAELLRQSLEDDGLDDQPIVHVTRSLLSGLRGQAGVADDVQSEVAAFRVSEGPQEQVAAALVEAMAAHAKHDFATVLERCRAALKHVPELSFVDDHLRWCWSVAAQAARRLDDPDALTQLVATVADIPIGHVPPVLRGHAASARAHLLAPHDPVAAAGLHDEAIETLRGIPAPYHLALALFERGYDADIAEAQEIATRLGAVPALPVTDDTNAVLVADS